MLVQRTEPLPIECVARGYLSGSGWKDYAATGEVCGIALPAGLRESERLPEPIFTPATKAQSGHDINISEAEAAELVGRRVLERVRDLTLRLYAEGAAHAESRGIIVADTKFEFGSAARRRAGRPKTASILIDEVLTPDSSRFWPRDGYAPGGPQPSFDKQFVRDYLERIQLEQAAAGALAARRRGREDPGEIRRGVPAADRAGTANDLLISARKARRRNGRQRRAVRGRRPRVREAVHRPRARAAATAASPRPPTRSASTATR